MSDAGQGHLIVAITDCRGFPDPGALEQQALGDDVDVRVGDVMTEDDVVRHATDADGIMVNMAPVTASVLERLPRLRAVVRYGVGMDNVDTRRAAELGVVALNVADYCVSEVAHHAVSMISATGRRLPWFARSVVEGEWSSAVAPPPVPVEKDPVGIVGFGRIGQRAAAMASALGHPVVAYDPYVPASRFTHIRRATSLHALAEEVNHLSLHTPLDDSTRGMVDADVLRLLGPDGHLVNTARGGLVDDGALLDVLNQQSLLWASLDVLPTEPPTGAMLELARHPRATVTPHVAYLSTESLPRLRTRAAGKLRSALDAAVGATRLP